MEKNTIEQINPSGSTTRYVEERTGIPTKYVVGAAVGLVGIMYLMNGKNKNGKPSFFRQYITPLIIAAAYKKVMEVVETATKKPEDRAIVTV